MFRWMTLRDSAAESFHRAAETALVLDPPDAAEVERGFAWVEPERSYARLGVLARTEYARILAGRTMVPLTRHDEPAA